jgi:hypothetical protein
METSGRSHEGWLVAVPVVVLLYVFLMFGDPEAFVRAASDGVTDVFYACAEWLRRL